MTSSFWRVPVVSGLFSSFLFAFAMISRPGRVGPSMQSSLLHARDEPFSPEKFFSGHHGELYMHGPKSRMHP